MVETVGFRQVMWSIMLESANDLVFGVDTPVQQVPPSVWYGMACLLIRDAEGSESCSTVWGKDAGCYLIHKVHDGLES
jgi:hypothetical protein